MDSCYRSDHTDGDHIHTEIIAGQICDKFWANCALFDKSMKFGTKLDWTKT